MDEHCLQQLARSRLEHVLLALRDGDRAYNIRDVLDPWWCFERGAPFVRPRRDGGYTDVEFNKPCAYACSNELTKFDALSEGAAAILKIGERARIVDRKNHPDHLRIVVDHAVPLSTICKHLWASPNSWDLESLVALLNCNFRRAVISFEENRCLDEKGLTSTMPEGWRIGDDPFARYAEVGIRLVN